MIIGSIDASINSTGISVYNLETKNYNFYYQNTIKKNIYNFNNINSDLIFKSKSKLDSEKYFISTNKIIDYLLSLNVTECAIENFAFGYSNNGNSLIFSIAESMGFLKYALMNNNIKIYLYSPKEIKKFAVKDGSASKVKIIQTFLDSNENSESIKKLINLIGIHKIYESPKNDIIDSYYLLNLHLSKNLKIK